MRPIYLDALGKANENEKKSKIDKEIVELCEVDPEEQEYVDLTITFATSQEGEIIQGIPIVRVWI